MCQGKKNVLRHNSKGNEKAGVSLKGEKDIITVVIREKRVSEGNLRLRKKQESFVCP